MFNRRRRRGDDDERDVATRSRDSPGAKFGIGGGRDGNNGHDVAFFVDERDDVETASRTTHAPRRDDDIVVVVDEKRGAVRSPWKANAKTIRAIVWVFIGAFAFAFAIGFARVTGELKRSLERSKGPLPSVEEPARSVQSSNASGPYYDETFQVRPAPENWQTFTYNDVRGHFDCIAHSREQSKPLFTHEQWQFMRDRYNEHVESRIVFDDPVPPESGYSLPNNTTAPFYGKTSPAGKGRGAFASKKIRMGRLVHHGDFSAVEFPDAMAWRRFAFSLPPRMACDACEWLWTQRLSKGGRLRLLMDMTVASLFNSGGWGEINVIPRDEYSLAFYAVREIKKDEEILYDYNVFETNWEEVGL